MADNTTLNSGTGGDVIATDDIGGVKHQRVKIEYGADGSATDVSGASPLPVIGASNSGVDIGDVTINNATGAGAVPIQDGGNSITVDGTVAATQSGTWNVTNVSGTVSLPTGAATAAKQPALGTAGTASSDVISIQGITGMTPVTTKESRVASATVTSVADSNVNQTLLAANAARIKFMVYNDSSATLYLKYGTTASSTDYSVKIFPEGFYADDAYTGRVDGIWSSDASGAAKVTEL